MSEQPLSGKETAGVVAGSLLTSGRFRLFAASVLFIGWIAYLGYAATMKSRDPIVSHIQAAVAATAVVAKVNSVDERGVKTISKLWGEGPEGEFEVINLADVRGFVGPGEYLLYLERYHGGWRIVGQQDSPGTHLSGVGKPLIYPWTDDVRKQAEKLKPTDK